MKPGIKGFLLGAVTTLLLTSASVAAAAGGTQIEVYFKSLKYMFDGSEKKPTGDSGFIYKGTTYVPLRFIGESLGKEVSWDELTNTIWVGEKPAELKTSGSKSEESSGNTQNLTSLPFKKEDEASMLNVDSWGKGGHNTAVHKTFFIGGTEYSTGLGLYLHDNPYPAHLRTGGTVELQLNGKYERLSGFAGADDSKLSNTAKGTMTFIADGKEVLALKDLAAGEKPRQVDLALSGVQTLRINFQSDRNGLINMILADPKLALADTAAASAADKNAEKQSSDVFIVKLDKTKEYVVIKNRGEASVDLKGWRLSNASSGKKVTFTKSFVLEPNSYVMLLSGQEGRNYKATGIDISEYKEYSQSLLWTTDPVWNDDKPETAELYDSTGTKVSEYKQ
ncbi:lamin tail domain-containing protein [Paenibacillus elgii]|uniref:lamin tail domain-containing protein n=1 Tax=Paenibacillus elgii TaxID=189691 RepID=UPI000FD7CD35|nr:lamin tail domain-containing protein [Paenibacillus elgii]NEN84847.1 hypothetical protein [Paenibacillus elgii]